VKETIEPSQREKKKEIKNRKGKRSKKIEPQASERAGSGKSGDRKYGNSRKI